MYTTIALAGFAILAQTAVGNAIPSGSGALRSMHPRSDGSFAGFYHNTTLGNGVFSVHIDENGEMVHAKLAESSGNSSLPHLKERSKANCHPYQNPSSPVVQCGNYAVDALDLATARQDLLPVCASYDMNNKVHSTRAIYAVYGDVQMYFCNYAHTEQQDCNADYLSHALSDIDCECPNHLSGWEYLNDEYRKYGFVITKEGFCEDNTCNTGCWGTK